MRVRNDWMSHSQIEDCRSGSCKTKISIEVLGLSWASAFLIDMLPEHVRHENEAIKMKLVRVKVALRIDFRSPASNARG